MPTDDGHDGREERIAAALEKIEARLAQLSGQIDQINSLLTVAYVLDLSTDIKNEFRASLTPSEPI
jgi:hypothetical protein